MGLSKQAFKEVVIRIIPLTTVLTKSLEPLNRTLRFGASKFRAFQRLY